MTTDTVQPVEVDGTGEVKRALLEINGVSKSFKVRSGLQRRSLSAVNEVTLSVDAGSTLGIVGESGCGKSTLARVILGLQPPERGSIRFGGQLVPPSVGKRPADVVTQMQMVFQDPFSALNPRASIGESIAFPMRVRGVPEAEIHERVGQVIEDVGLPRNYVNHYPHQLSGGQRQRVNIARALVLRPALVVLDEAVSALDKSIQAQILNLLEDLQAEYDLTYVFISHDLNVVQYMSDRVAVMYLGEVVEYCDAETLYHEPLHPYTRMLLDSVPTIDPDDAGAVATEESGEIPSPLDPPSGCRFRTRCPFAMEVCAERAPAPLAVAEGHLVSCHLYPGPSAVRALDGTTDPGSRSEVAIPAASPPAAPASLTAPPAPAVPEPTPPPDESATDQKGQPDAS